jgi:NAD(P)-dependent dehydrogenase (short-subunit alcohol dehydrogenase family)
LADAGAHILIGDLDEDSALKAAAYISNNYGVTAIGMVLDVTDASSVAAVADAANARLGGISIWVNNAGRGTDLSSHRGEQDRRIVSTDAHRGASRDDAHQQAGPRRRS